MDANEPALGTDPTIELIFAAAEARLTTKLLLYTIAQGLTTFVGLLVLMILLKH